MSRRAKKNLYRVPKHGSTITHPVVGVFGSGRVLLKPASPGTGVIAGGGVRAVLELAGIHDILSKSLGTQNPINLVKATLAGLQDLRTPEEVAEIRGLSIAEVLGLSNEQPAGAVETLEGAPRATTSAPRRRRGGRDRGGPAEEAEGGSEEPEASRLMPKVTQIKSKNGSNQKQLDTLRSLGLRKIGHTVEVKDSEQARGMLHRVRHLIKVEED